MNLYQDSFATYSSIASRYPLNSNSGNGSITTGGRFDLGALSSQGVTLYTSLGKNAGTVFVGMALNSTGWSNATVFSLLDSSFPVTNIGTEQIRLAITTAGIMSVFRSSTNLGSASTAVTPNVWHYVEMGVFFNGTTGWVTVKLDGVTVISVTNVNTMVTGDAYANQLCIQAGQSLFSATTVVDDVYVNDSTGSFNNTFSGDVKIIGGNPTGNGALQAWAIPPVARSTAYLINSYILDPNGNLQKCTTAGTTAGSAPTYNSSGTTTDGSAIFTYQSAGSGNQYKLVNEKTSDDDLGYLVDATIGDQSTFTFPATTGNSVLSVFAIARVRKDDAGNRAVRLLAKSGATVGDNGVDMPLLTTYQNLTATFEVDPATSSAWTLSAANAAEFGVKVTA